MRSGGALPPPPPRGYLSDTCAIHYENKAPLRYYLERVLRDMGGISHWAAKGMSVDGWMGAGSERAVSSGALLICRHHMERPSPLPGGDRQITDTHILQTRWTMTSDKNLQLWDAIPTFIPII